jgi:outer membrane protein OmpA-like peptidoglycan-associated protein
MRCAIPALIFVGYALAQIPNPTQAQPAPAGAAEGQSVPLFKVTVVSRTTKAINYFHREGATHVDFRGTALMPATKGEASVDSRLGSTKVETHLDHMTPANQFGPEYMTYVLWAITPEGRATNLGEVVLEGDHANLLSTTDLQSFGLIVTAEPYFAVTQPSDVVVAENFVRNDTSGTIEQVDAKYELLQRGGYVLNRPAYKPIKVDPKGPLQLAEAENAVEIARLAGADRYAGDTFSKAQIDLQNAEGFLTTHDRKRSETNAREAAQMAEDARIITIRKEREESLANERAAAAQREAEANGQAEQAAEQARLEQQRRAQAESEREAAELAKRQADIAAAKANEAAAQAVKERADADAARAAAVQQQQALAAQAEQARLDAQQAQKEREQAETEKAQLRERLRQQLSAILETQETARGLIVSISDVLFDFNKYTLKPGAREKMAKVSGILLAYPGLKIRLEGHTDAIGNDDYNMKLSGERANAVRDYLVGQGVPATNVMAVGLGKADPVASNSTDAGRQRNRRVEMVVSGEPIGISGLTTPNSAANGQQ